MNEKFNYGCFIPSFGLVMKVSSIILMIFGLSYIGVWDYLSSISHILKEVLHYGIFLFIGIYLIYYEASFLETFRELNSGIKGIIQEKIEEYDKGLDEHLLEDVDERITCFSRFLQYLLSKINIPEDKVRKVTVKRISGVILRWILIYPIVFTIIIFWDLLFRTVLPFIWEKAEVVLNLIYTSLKIDILILYIRESDTYKKIMEEIEYYNLGNILLVISFSLLFALMEFMGAYSMILFAAGSFVFGILMYAAKFAVFIPIHKFHDAKAEDMRTVSWFEFREEDIFILFTWFEKLNVYKRVMGVLKKIKAILNTIILQLRKLLVALKALFLYYYKFSINSIRSVLGMDPLTSEEENVDLIEEIKIEHDSLWKNVVKSLKSFFDGFSDILSKESKCLELKTKSIDAYNKFEIARLKGDKKSLGGLKTAYNKAFKKYNDCIENIKKEVEDD
jgi:hypothetical protein